MWVVADAAPMGDSVLPPHWRGSCRPNDILSLAPDMQGGLLSTVARRVAVCPGLLGASGQGLADQRTLAGEAPGPHFRPGRVLSVRSHTLHCTHHRSRQLNRSGQLLRGPG